MQNNDLIGKVVLSKAGRDKNHLYIITNQINSEYVLVADGNIKTINNPKKKNLKHLSIICNINEDVRLSILRNEKSWNVGTGAACLQHDDACLLFGR